MGNSELQLGNKPACWREPARSCSSFESRSTKSADLEELSIRIPKEAAGLLSPLMWWTKERRSSPAQVLIGRLTVTTRMVKAWSTLSGSAGSAKVTLGLSSVGPPPVTSSNHAPRNYSVASPDWIRACECRVRDPRVLFAPATRLMETLPRGGGVMRKGQAAKRVQSAQFLLNASS